MMMTLVSFKLTNKNIEGWFNIIYWHKICHGSQKSIGI